MENNHKQTNFLHEMFSVLIIVSIIAIVGGILVMGLYDGLLDALVSDLTALSINAGVLAKMSSSMHEHYEQWDAATRLTILFSLICCVLFIIFFNVTEPKDDHECPW